MDIRGTKGALVVAAWNHFALTQRFLESLAKAGAQNWRVFLIDNGSSDETPKSVVALATRLGIDLVYLRNADNQGCARAWNRGLRQAIAEAYALIGVVNNDLVFSSRWDKGLRNFWRQHGTQFVISPHVLRGTLSQFDENAEAFARRNQKRIRKQLVSAAMFMDAGVFAKIGFFDERFFVGFEDYDFMIRLQAAGIGFRTLGNSVVWHKEKSSRSALSADHETEGQRLFLEKWGPSAMGHAVVGIPRMKKRYWRLRERFGLL